MQPYFRTGAAALVLLASAALVAPTAEAQTPYYQGKTVRLVVGFTPGGGYDTYARLLSRHFGNHIPGKPTVIVENMPGAGSLTAVRWLDGPAPKDGTAITAYNPGLITQGMLDEPEAASPDSRRPAKGIKFTVGTLASCAADQCLGKKCPARTGSRGECV